MSDGSERFTLDTNLLVYSIERNAGARHQLAAEIVNRAVDLDCWLTLQSLSEFYSAATRKRIATAERAAELIGTWLQLFRIASASAASVRAALIEARRKACVLLGRTADRDGCRGRVHVDPDGRPATRIDTQRR